jgi:hypothetical protein
MYKPGKTYILILILLIFKLGSVCSQTTSSPYSIFGLGYLEGNSIGPFKAMGGTSIAFLSDRSINIMNPASYSGIDSLMSIFEVGVFGKYTIFSTSRENQSLVNANLKYMVMGFRITPWLATSFGFSPYSSIGYNITTNAPIEGTDMEYTETFSGDGGINQVYLGGSVKVLKNLSLGFNAAYLFGNITRSESSTDFTYYLEDATYVSNFDFNYGLNYQLKIKKWKYNLGLIYGNSKKLKTKNVTTIQTETETETLRSRKVKYSIPQNIGAGFTLSKGFFTAGIDYEWSKWEDIKFTNNYLQTRNSNRYSFGVEFPSQGVNKGTGKMIFYRFGGEYCQSYLVIDDTPINYRAITVGAGIPLNGVFSVINVSLELGQNGTTKGGLFRENFVILHLDMSLRNLWFMKRKYD